MHEIAVPSHLPEHRRLREATRYTATVVNSILEQLFRFDSIVDLGCGTGNWLSSLAAMGQRTVLGVEQEQFAESEYEIDPNLILHVDLGQYLNLQRRFDLALCLEVAEHLDQKCAPMVVENCTRHSDIVLFSAALPGQQGLHHVNEQPPGYWANLFDGHGYAVFDSIRPLIWDDPQIPVWYRQNIMLFVHRSSTAFAVVQERAQAMVARRPLALAHPEYLAYFSDVALKSREAEASLSAKIGSLSAEIRQLVAQLNDLKIKVSDNEAREVAVQPEVQVHHNTSVVHAMAWGTYRTLRPLGRRLPLPMRRSLLTILRKASRVVPLPVPPPSAVNVIPAAAPASVDPSIEPPLPDTRRNTIVFVSGEAHTPGHVYRVLHLTQAAAAIGADSHWFALEDHAAHGAVLRSANVVIMWRAANSPATAAVIRAARDSSAKILFDIDDLVFLPEIANRKIIDGIRSQNFSEVETARLFQRFREVMQQADACLCTTRELADQIRQLGMLAYLLPNGFDYKAFGVARCASRQWQASRSDDFIRIGYASGSRTHQRDFAVAASAIARVLEEKPDCRLVLFRTRDTAQPLLDVEEFACLNPFADQIEWRDLVPVQDLPNEIARFDINLAPLEVGNIFCESKSELKYYEAALVNVCTMASPTGPMQRAITHGETGMLASNPDDWYAGLTELAGDPALRQRLARAAFFDSIDRFGPDRQQEYLLAALQELSDGPRGARSLQTRLSVAQRRPETRPLIPRSEVLFSSDAMRASAVTVIIPLHNYAEYIVEALESVRLQTLSDLDVIVIDDASTDSSAKLAVTWMHDNAKRFNRALVIHNTTNAGLALTRNAGFDAAETAFILPLDADNKLRPRCCELCLDALRTSSAGFAYPTIQTFGESNELMGTHEFLPTRFIAGNYVDAMALVAKWAWLRVGGYAHIKYGWEDYDFWCRCLEHGIGGVRVRDILADYRVHGTSMLHTQTDVPTNKERLITELERRHPWLRIARPVA